MTVTRHETWLIVGLLLVSLALHFVALGYPREVIFDEVHFGKFITAYCCTGERFFDIHPPHAKLLIAATAWLGGYRGDFPFEHIGQPYGDVPVIALRAAPALMGTLLPLVIYVLLRQLGVTSLTALLGGAAILFDNALTIQSRVIALDSLLLITTFGSISAYVAAVRAQKRRWIWFVAAGALAGVAVGTKFTGLAALGLLGVLVLIEFVRTPSRANYVRWFGIGMLIITSAAVVYLGGWALHFILLPLPGPGDAFHVPTSLVPPQAFSPLHFIQETSKLHRIMFDANYHLTAGHPNASRWWSWPFMQMPVFYWAEGNGGLAQIYFVGNPVVWWGASLLFVVACLATIIQFGQRHRPRGGQLWLPLLGFLIAMVPLVRVPRALFLYHYLTPLIFSLLAGLIWVERCRVRAHLSKARYQQIIAIAVLLLIAGFASTFPLTYGTKLGTTIVEKDARVSRILFWLPDAR